MTGMQHMNTAQIHILQQIRAIVARVNMAHTDVLARFAKDI